MIMFSAKGDYSYKTEADNQLMNYWHNADNYETTDVTRLLQFDINC